MIVQEAVIWYNPKLGRWVFTLVVLKKRRTVGGSVRLDYSTVLPNVR